VLTGLVLALVVAAIGVPVVLSAVLARQAARAAQAERALFYARDILRRADGTGMQDNSAFDALAKIPGAEQCSPETLSELRRISATSPYIQFVGVIRGNELICSSYGIASPPINLGAQDYTTPKGQSVRRNATFPFAANERFLTIDNGRFVVVIHKALLVDEPLVERGVTVGLASASHGFLFASRGAVDPQWIPRETDIQRGESRTLMIGPNLVAQMRSKRFDAVAIAALDATASNGSRTRFMAVLLPIGLVLGLLLAYGIIRIAKSQTSVAAAIKAALRDREFHVAFQPIVRLSDRRWVGAEALLRWERQDGKALRTELVIQAAEDAGLITAITARVVELVEPLLADLAKTDEDVFLSINLSAADLQSDNTMPLLQGLIERTGCRPSQLHVEITERGFNDTLFAREMVKQMRAIGIGVSIDDFGTGYSSLSELNNFELDTIKIDKSFVDTVGSNAVTNQIAFLIVEMARQLQLNVIAEGIETAAQFEILSEWGVGCGQGWYFSEAIVENQFRAALGMPNREL
jgi:sensor c-di-GMP phosphodiesterase-like protein